MINSIRCSDVEGDITDFGSQHPAKYGACQVLDLRQNWLGPEQMPEEGACAYVGREGSALCFYIRLVDSLIYTEAERDNDRMWTLGDTVEFFIKPGVERNDYWELHVAPNDLIMDIYIPSREKFTQGEITWEEVVASCSGASKRVEVMDGSWAVELKVPWTAFGLEVAPPPGTVWQFAVCRYNYPGKLKDPEHSSTAPLTEAGFHTYENYTDLLF